MYTHVFICLSLQHKIINSKFESHSSVLLVIIKASSQLFVKRLHTYSKFKLRLLPYKLESVKRSVKSHSLLNAVVIAMVVPSGGVFWNFPFYANLKGGFGSRISIELVLMVVWEAKYSLWHNGRIWQWIGSTVWLNYAM